MRASSQFNQVRNLILAGTLLIGATLINKLFGDAATLERPKTAPATTSDVLKRGEIIRGKAYATDGDTIRIGEHKIRVYGIDAPESRQNCQTAERQVPCGKFAKDHLAALLAQHAVACEVKAVDRYKRYVALCTANGIDVGRQMVRDGFAKEYRQYSRGEYTADEAYARDHRLGTWAYEMDDPAHWRACNLPQRKNSRPADCPQ